MIKHKGGEKMRKRITLLTLALIAVLLSVSAVSAADIYVNTTGNDTTGNGTSENPFLTIEKGVSTAVAGDTVNIADGTYSGTGNNQITIYQPITIQGQSQNRTIINGAGNQIFYNNANGVTIRNLTFVNATNWFGGAIYNNYNTNITIDSCTFKNNSGDYGGAIGNDGDMTINHCTFTGNSAEYGGAVYHCDGRMTITNCTFTGNTAEYGGAVGTDSGLLATTVINNSIFDQNNATDGGAVYSYWSIAITGCNFNKNIAGNNGGAICSVYDILTVKYSRFVGNNATSLGKDIYSHYGGLQNATLNWWGSNSGPAYDRIYIVDTNMQSTMYSPWLVMNIKPADPSTIYTGQTSKVTVNVYTDSNGVDHSADSAQFFSGPEVTFKTNLGNVGSKSVTVPWSLGSAFAILRGDEGPGMATVTGTDGNQTLSAGVNILQAPTVEAASTEEGTIGMQKTGMPVAGLVLAILAVLGGALAPRRK